MRPARGRTAALIVFALALAGCAQAPGGPPPSVSDGNVSPPPPQAAAAPTGPAPAPVAAKPPERAYPPPSSLMGLDGNAVAALLGPPRLKRQDAPAEIWLYRSAACALNLFLYQPAGGGAYRVSHFEARGAGQRAGLTETECFRSLLDAHEKRAQG